MSKIEFENVTILYDKEKVNKKLCKKKDILMHLWFMILTVTIFTLLILGAIIFDKMQLSEILSILILLVFVLVSEVGLVLLGNWFLYHKTIKAFLFAEWMFEIKNVYADWYNDKILLRVNHLNGIDYYSLQGFVRSIKNELEITDKSDKSKPIHIYIDITNDNKTCIVIENVVI